MGYASTRMSRPARKAGTCKVVPLCGQRADLRSEGSWSLESFVWTASRLAWEQGATIPWVVCGQRDQRIGCIGSPPPVVPASARDENL